MNLQADQEHLVLHTRVVTGTGGGPDKTILNSPRFLEESGFPAVCAFMRHPDDPLFAELERRAHAWRAPILPVDDYGPLDWRLPNRFRAICRERKPAIWHGHDYKSNLVGLLLRRRQPMKLVTTVHGWVKHTWKTPLYYAIDRMCLPRYDQVICVSRDLYDECLKLGVHADRCWYVPNGIDVREFKRRESVASAKARLGLPAERLLIGAVGRLSKEKRFDLLIRAVARLIEDKHDVELWIAGEGDRESALNELIGDLGVEDRVKLIGFCEEPLSFYHAVDVFALSSIREGLPNSLLEAMAVELPVVATRVAGVPDLIKDGHNGLSIEPGSADVIHSSLATLLADKGLRDRLGAAARRTVEVEHSFKHRMDKIKAIYKHTLSTNGATL